MELNEEGSYKGHNDSWIMQYIYILPSYLFIICLFVTLIVSDCFDGRSIKEVSMKQITRVITRSYIYTQGCIQRGAELLDYHLHQLHYGSNDGDEEDEGQEGEVDSLDKCIGAEHVHLQSIVHGYGDDQHKGDCDTQAERGLNGLRHSQVWAHTQEEGKYHVVHKDGADK